MFDPCKKYTRVKNFAWKLKEYKKMKHKNLIRKRNRELGST